MLNWGLALIVTQFFDQYQDFVGPAYAWWTFATFSGIGILFTFFLLPETRGKTLEEIQRGFAK